MKDKNSKNNRYVGFESLSLHYTQHFCSLPAVKLYKAKELYHEALPRSEYWRLEESEALGPCAAKVTSFHGNMLRHSAKGKWYFLQNCIMLAKLRMH